MNTKIMAFGGIAALVLLVGVGLFAAAGSVSEDSPVGDGIFGDMFGKGSDNGKGDMERAMDGDCENEDPVMEQAREQAVDGSCEGEPSGEPVQTREQARSEGENAPEEAEQTREQAKDGSCEGEPSGEPVQTQEQTREREQLQDGSCDGEGSGDQTQEREQLKDGSCTDDEADDSVDTASTCDGSQERSGDLQQDRDRDQVNGGTGPQYRYGDE